MRKANLRPHIVGLAKLRALVTAMMFGAMSVVMFGVISGAVAQTYLADQIAKGSENFELQLEPESFGKMRVNVTLESSNVEVKMVAENSAAVMVLKGSESILQNIAEQNGLKLSDYSVDMQNNQNGDNANRKDGYGKNRDNGTEVVKETDDENNNTSSENEYKLNLLA